MKGLVLLGAAAAFVAITFVVINNDAPNRNCPDPHWHVGFDVYYQDDSGESQRLEFATPRWNNNPNLAYYEFGNGPGNYAGGMSMATHLHMGGQGAEAGVSSSLNQFHLEDAGHCVGVQEMFHAVDVDLTDKSMKLDGGLTQNNEETSFAAHDAHRMRYWTQSIYGNWTEVQFKDVKGKQIPDGGSILVAFGDYTDAQVKAMQDAVQPPASRSSAIARDQVA